MRVVVLCLLLAGCGIQKYPHGDKIIHGGMGAATYGVDDTCIVSAFVGVGKELNDSRTHRADPLDAGATVAGCLLIRGIIQWMNDGKSK